MLWGNTAYRVKLGGEDLSRYSRKTESVGFGRCPSVLSLSYQESDASVRNILQSLTNVMAGKSSWHGLDTV